MKRGLSAPRHQSGIALLALLFALTLAGIFAFYRSANLGFAASQHDGKLILRLAKAKEALIAYAVIDAKRPGRMLCPDVVGDGVSPLLNRNDCDGWATGDPDVYAGWLPWKTLDLLEAGDDEGSKFRYVTSRFFGGDRSGVPLNSETAPSLHLDVPAGTGNSDIVALIIAPRGALDTRNADGDAYYFTGSAKIVEDNDLIAVINRQELMAAVEKRIAGELRNCLEEHAANALDFSYPWPAPLSNNIYKGQAKTLFGMVPATQPGGNPDDLLKQARLDFDRAKTIFTTALTADNAEEKLAAVSQLQEAAAYARALYERLYIVATDLYVKAQRLAAAFDTLDETLGTITANSGSFVDGAAGIPAAIDLAQPELEAFRISLANSGFDLFLMELESENAKLLSKIALAMANPGAEMAALQSQTNLFKSKLLANSLTPNRELSAQLASNIDLATVAVDAVKGAKFVPSDQALVSAAINSASALAGANQTLDQAIQEIRLNLDPLLIEALNENISQASAAFVANPEPVALTSLARALNSLHANAGLILRGSNAVMSAKASLLASLEPAINAAVPGAKPALIQSSVAVAIDQASTLVLAMKENGDNLAQATLEIATELLSLSKQTAPPTLAAGRDLRALAKLVSYWADNATTYAKSIAQKARRKVTADIDSDFAAYFAAQQLLNSLNGSTGTVELLKRAINTPSDTSALAKAQAALDKTQRLLDVLGTQNTALESALQSALADAATPTQWYGNACGILRPATGSNSWWVSNQWAEYFFYQIGERTRPLPANQKCAGKLKVNGTGEHCVVTLSAGRPLNGQTRSNRAVSQYLDDAINADTSRNGDAKNPRLTFSSKPVSANFNDRLAY